MVHEIGQVQATECFQRTFPERTGSSKLNKKRKKVFCLTFVLIV